MAAFNYNISVTGDCLNTGSGAITILPYGGTPPYTVEWVEPSLGADIIELIPSIRTNLTSTTYGVRLNDSTLPVNNEFYVNIPVSSGVCINILDVQPTTCGLDNGSVSASSTSNFSSTNFYLFTSEDVLVSTATTNINLAVFGSLSAGTYYVTSEDLGGCVAASEIFIVDDSVDFDFGLYIVPNSSCGGTPIGKIYVTGQTGTSPYTYLWSNGMTGSTVTGLTAGNYSVAVTDVNGCTLTKSATITNIDPIGFGVFVSEPPTCLLNNGELSLTITGGTAPFYYSASTGQSQVTYDRTFVMSNLAAGSYQIQVTDAGFCTFITGTTLSSPNGIQQVDISTINSDCSNEGGVINVVVVGGTPPMTYSLIRPGGNTTTVTTNQVNYSYPNLSSGTYTIAVEDSNECSYSEEVVLVSEAKFSLSYTSNTTTCGLSNGQIDVSISTGGTEPYDYYLDNANGILNTILTAVTFNNVGSGQHQIKVIDSNGCTQQSEVFVNFSNPVNFSLFTTSCGDGDSGTITAFINNGTPPFILNWSDNIVGNPQELKITGLTAGTYSLTIEDSVGCSLQRTVQIECSGLYGSYQVYLMGGEEFQLEIGGKCGLLQLLNQGYYDLTTGTTGCNLVSAEFIAKVRIEPMGSVYTNSFFTTNSISLAPPDNLWYDTIKDLLLSISGISQVDIDELNNTITIYSDANNTLNGQYIIVELAINYDIDCKELIQPTQTITSTPTQTPTNTSTLILTPSVTPTSSNTPTIGFTPSVTPTNTTTPTIGFTPSVTPTNTTTPTNTITSTQTPTPSQTQPIEPPITPSVTQTQTVTPTKTLTPTPTATPTSTNVVVQPIVTNLFSFVTNELGEYYVNAEVTLDINVDVTTLFLVRCSTTISGDVLVPVTITSGNNFGSLAYYVGNSDPGTITNVCIFSCDNPNIILTGFNC